MGLTYKKRVFENFTENIYIDFGTPYKKVTKKSQKSHKIMAVDRTNRFKRQNMDGQNTYNKGGFGIMCRVSSL